MLSAKLRGKAAIWVGLWIILFVVELAIDTATNEALQIIVYLLLFGGYAALWPIPALRGNLWRSANLVNQGYEIATSVEARTKNAAIAIATKPDAD